MNKKELYEQPNVDVFTLQSEGVICQSGFDANNNTEDLGFPDIINF